MIINSQLGGKKPTGTKQITTNGVHDVAGYENADVQVPTTAPAHYVEKTVDANGKLMSGTSIINLNGVTDVGDFVLMYAYYRAFFPTNTSADLSSLTTISGNNAALNMFAACSNLTSVDLSSLETVSGQDGCANMFHYCSNLTSVDLSSLETVSGQNGCANMFAGCVNLTSIDLSSLETVSGNNGCFGMFQYCSNLTSVDLSGLTTVSGSSALTNMFSGCTNLSTVILSDALTKRNPIPMFVGAPLTTNPYENCEYITGNTDGLCKGTHFASTNMYAFELCNSSNTSMFANNTYLEEAKFPVLTRWNGSGYAASMFSGCTNANFTDVYFPMLCVFRNAVPFNATSFPSQLTVHFRKDQQTLIESTSGAASNFGAAALVFDQIGTITVNGTNYIRQGKCNETGYYAWQKATSNITVGGQVYTFDISLITRNTAPDVAGPMLYGWKTSGGTEAYTDSLKPQVGDCIWTAFNVAQSTTPIDAVDNEFIYTVDSAEPDVGDTVYSDAQGTVFGTISAVA